VSARGRRATAETPAAPRPVPPPVRDDLKRPTGRRATSSGWSKWSDGVHDERVLSAIAQVPRAAFVPPEIAGEPCADQPIRIRTASRPPSRRSSRSRWRRSRWRAARRCSRSQPATGDTPRCWPGVRPPARMRLTDPERLGDAIGRGQVADAEATSASPKWWRSGGPVDGLHPGDGVVALWHVSCWRRDRSRRGVPTSCRRGRRVRRRPGSCLPPPRARATTRRRRGTSPTRRDPQAPRSRSARGLRKRRFCPVRGRPAGPHGSTTWVRTPRLGLTEQLGRAGSV
jgi:hypothetical protein